MSALSITWLGNAAYEISVPSIGAVFVDPWIEGNPGCPITLDDIHRARVVVVSHGHPGHFGNSVFIAAKTGATFVSNERVADYVRDARLLPGSQVVGIPLGDAWDLDGLSISFYPISHPPLDVVSYAPAEPNTASVIRHGDLRLFHAGDIDMDPAIADIGAAASPTHAIVPLTGADAPLAARRAAAAALALGAHTVIPTCRFSAYPARVSEFKRLTDAKSHAYRIREPVLGQSLSLRQTAS